MTVQPIQPAQRDSRKVREIGSTNPSRLGSTLYEDFLWQLQGRNAERVYREMANNDATVGAILYAIEQLIRQVDWTVESDDESVQDFIKANMDDLDTGWDDFISAALSMIPYGWSMFEIVHRLVDGQVWWDKFGFRNQSSLNQWILDDKGNLLAFEQMTRTGTAVVIPAPKLIHFRTSTAEGRPEGRSWLRRAYRAWYLKKRAEDHTAIGIERDLNGMPVAWLPPEIILEDGEEYRDWKKIVTGVKVDDLQGMILPLERDEAGSKIYDFELLQTSGRPKTDPLAFIRSQAMDIASVMLAQWIGLGRDAVGSRALSEPQQEVFQTALSALLDTMEEQFHRQATAPLLEMNGMESGRVVHGELRDVDLDALGNFIQRVAGGGYDWTAPEGDPTAVPDEIRQMAGLDPLEAAVIEDENVKATPASEQEEDDDNGRE